MRKSSIVEIRVEASKLLVTPSSKGLHRPKFAQQLADEVSTEIDVPRAESLTVLIVDLANVSWIASAGLNELIRLQAHARSSGIRLQLQSPSDTVREIFRMTRLERTFELSETVSGEGKDAAAENDALDTPLTV